MNDAYQRLPGREAAQDVLPQRALGQFVRLDQVAGIPEIINALVGDHAAGGAVLHREVGDIGPLAEALLGHHQDLLGEVLHDLHANDLVVAVRDDATRAGINVAGEKTTDIFIETLVDEREVTWYLARLPAGATAVLAMTVVGVPARVATGYAIEESARQGGGQVAPERMEAMRALQSEQRAALRAVLTPEQQARFDRNVAAMPQGRGMGGGGRPPRG